MRTMFDSVSAHSIPPGAQLVAGYTNGDFPSYWDLAALFPTLRRISITVDPDDFQAHMCDVEAGDFTPMQAVQFIADGRARGLTKTVYCSRSNVDPVLADARTIGVALPIQFSIALWDEDPTIPTPPPGALFMSKQYRHDIHEGDFNYDISSVVDHWPGVDTGLDPFGGGTQLGGFLMALTDAQQIDLYTDQQQDHYTIQNQLLPAVAAIRTQVNAIAGVVGKPVTAVMTPEDEQALATEITANLTQTLPSAVVAAIAAALAGSV